MNNSQNYDSLKFCKNNRHEFAQWLFDRCEENGYDMTGMEYTNSGIIVAISDESSTRTRTFKYGCYSSELEL